MYHNPFPPCAKALGSRARTRSHTKARSSPSSARRHANGRKSASAHSAVTPTRHNEGAAGIKVPEQRTVVSKGGRRFKLADFAEGERLADWWRAKGRTEAERETLRAKLRAGLDVDAMLGNWDVIGMGGDNILVDKDGEPWRIDNGGALGFRAQGARKADADWKDGWPNELFTIAGSANNAPYVGGTSSLTLIRQAATRDWEKVVAALPDQADRDALTRRVAEMRQLAARTDDFDRGGYDDAFTARVIEHSFNLSKEGFREEVPKTIKHGDYGFCRSKPSTAGLVGGEPGEEYGSLALAAAKTVGTHQKDGNYNQATLEAFYAKEPELKAILKADPKNAGAAHYLKVMQQIKDAITTQTALNAFYANEAKLKATLEKDPKNKSAAKQLASIQQSKASIAELAELAKLPHVDTSIRVRTLKTEQQPDAKYTSLTDHVAQYMAAHGGDYGFITGWSMSQGTNSWTGGPNTCRRKVVQLAARGLNWDPPPPAPGVWYGGGTDQRAKARVAAYERATEFYKERPGQLKKDVETIAQYKAAVQLLLENADFEGNDKASRAVKLVRTEHNGVIAKRPTVGKAYDYSMGPTESFSVFRTVTVGGNNCVVAEVPWSRVNAAYFMERTPGKNNTFFLDDAENEFNVDGIGLRRVFAGKVKPRQLAQPFHSLL